MAHRKQMIATLNLVSILSLASLDQVHAASFGEYLADGIFWSSVGAAGQVDSNAATIAKTTKSMITMAKTGTMVVRYNVSPNAELATSTGAAQLMASLVDPGVGASVDVSLVEVSLDDASSSARTITHLNSSDFDAQGVTSFATRCGSSDGMFSGFNFTKNAYYIHAVLSWNATQQPRAPTLRAVKIGISGDNLCAASK